MSEAAHTPEAEGTGWADMFRVIRGGYTVLLKVGIGVHAIDIFVITTVMPAVVADIGGVEFYAWTTMLYMVGTVMGAAGGRYARSVMGRKRSYVGSGLIFLAGALGGAFLIADIDLDLRDITDADGDQPAGRVARLLQAADADADQSKPLVQHLFQQRFQDRLR